MIIATTRPQLQEAAKLHFQAAVISFAGGLNLTQAGDGYDKESLFKSAFSMHARDAVAFSVDCWLALLWKRT
jgi:hypothetical protein